MIGELEARKLIEPFEPVLMYWRLKKFPIPDEIFNKLEELQGRKWGYLFCWQNFHGQVQFVRESEVTDYGSIIYDDEEDAPPSKRCSTANDFGKFIGHVANLRQVLKSAEKDGFCLDELLNALPALEKVLMANKTTG